MSGIIDSKMPLGKVVKSFAKAQRIKLRGDATLEEIRNDEYFNSVRINNYHPKFREDKAFDNSHSYLMQRYDQQKMDPTERSLLSEKESPLIIFYSGIRHGIRGVQPQTNEGFIIRDHERLVQIATIPIEERALGEMTTHGLKIRVRDLRLERTVAKLLDEQDITLLKKHSSDEWMEMLSVINSGKINEPYEAIADFLQKFYSEKQ